MGGQKTIDRITHQQLITSVVGTQIFFLAASLFLGFLLFESFHLFTGLFAISSTMIGVGVAAGLMIVFLDIWLMKLLPSRYYDDGGINEKLFSNASIAQLLWLAMIVALAEELLFRGVIQTNTSWMLASLLFAIVHFRYLNHWYLTLNIVILSFIIGGIYEWTNSLWSTISLHFIVNLLLGLYIQQKSKHKKRKEGELHETRSLS
ncbi:CPBP family intramembrane glutamic endopeptidase [Jeotgalibacillus campisalis]|uniref:CAAX amino terminal protease family protein n=1 Tax=Jeotgalibacillus campisalis TaxID=220754 RepID=A0A0C2RCU3_9BACL|nr:CPBP family intramembrane glutamic endopeptidase [Jeotgalibacillus campisalis]KIL48095.1 CAAX amino terminal protease family protein [Jeotgalibacillus campisalis]